MGCSMSRKRRQPQLTEVKRFSKQNIHNYYRFGKILGSGGFGTVKLAYSLEQEKNGLSSKQYAVKTVDKVIVLLFQVENGKELEILIQLDHPNIIRVYEEYEDARYYHFVMEFCGGGELLERIIKKGAFSERKAQIIMKQLFSAVQYMHDLGITHRDLKPENLILASLDNDYDIRIIDFGLSKKYPPTDTFTGRSQSRQQTRVGTPVYVAPEVLTGFYSSSCDEWSLGCIMHVLLSGEPPFYSNNLQKLENKIMSQKVKFEDPIWNKVSQEAKDLVFKLLDKNPKKRITCCQALESAWVKKFDILKSFDQKYSTGIDDKVPLDNDKAMTLLKTYGNASKLKKETLKLLLNQLNEQQIQLLRCKFEMFDKDNSGTITMEEMLNIVQEMDLHETETEIKEMMSKFSRKANTQEKSSKPDKKHSLVIRYTDFMSALLNCSTYLHEQRIWSLFQQYDTDNKNYITMLDIKMAIERRGQAMSDNKLEQMFKEIDKTSKGYIEFEDFQKLMLEDLILNVDQEEQQDNRSHKSQKLIPAKGDFNIIIQ